MQSSNSMQFWADAAGQLNSMLCSIRFGGAVNAVALSCSTMDNEE